MFLALCHPRGHLFALKPERSKMDERISTGIHYATHFPWSLWATICCMGLLFLTPDNKINFCANQSKYPCWVQLLMGWLGTSGWQKGDPQSFLVWTDHCTLQDLCSAKTRNRCQARWTLYSSHFHLFIFHLSYRPGSKNTKPDAPSRPLSTARGERNYWREPLWGMWFRIGPTGLQFCTLFSCELMVTIDHTIG